MLIGGLAGTGAATLAATIFFDTLGVHRRRSELLKNVPAASEGQALKNFSYKIWTGFMVHKNTADDVVTRLHAAIGKTLQDPAARTQLAAQTMLASAPMTLAESAKFFDAETARYRASPSRSTCCRSEPFVTYQLHALQARAGEFISLRRDIRQRLRLKNIVGPLDFQSTAIFAIAL